MNIQTRKYKQQVENYQLQTLDDLVNSKDDWTNIQDIIQMTIKKQSEIMNKQQRQIKELERQMEQKADRTEIEKNMMNRSKNSEIYREMSQLQCRIDNKVDRQDLQKILDRFVQKHELEQQLDDKVGLDEMKTLVESKVNHNQMKTELVSIQNKIQKMQEQWNRNGLGEQQQLILKNHRDIQSQLINKVDREVMESELGLKANKQSVMTALKRKMNKEECQQMMKQKVDMKEVVGLGLQIQRKINMEDMEQQVHQIYQEMKIISEQCEQNNSQLMNCIKQEQQKMQNMSGGLIKEMEQYQYEMQKDIQNSKQGLSDVSVMISQLQQKSIKREQWDELKQQLNKKIDDDLYNQMLKSQREEIWKEIESNQRSMDSNQRSMKQWRKENEMKQEEMKIYIEGWIGKIGEQHMEWDKEMGSLQKRQSDNVQEVNNQINSIRIAVQQQNKREMEILNSKLQKVNEQSNSRLSLQQYKNEREGLEQQIGQKVDIDQIQSAFDKQQSEYQMGLECLKQEIKRMIQDSMQDYNEMYQTKADRLMVEQQYVGQKQMEAWVDQLQNKVEVVEYEDMQKNIDLLCQNMQDRVKVVLFEDKMDQLNQRVQQLQRDINRTKDSTQKNHVDQQVIDFNREVEDIKQNMNNLITREQFDEFTNDQTLINESLCTENILGRWTWKNGQLNNHMIPWEMQVVNTLPDNFIWDKDKTVIIVSAPGLYEVNFGFYQRNKAEVDLIVNNESILLLGDVDQKTVQHSQGNLVGITYRDCLVLPARCRISIGYKGDYGGEGFIGLKRL